MRTSSNSFPVAILVAAFAAAASGTAAAASREILAASARVDALVEQNLAALKIEPYPRTSDEVFFRRVYLDIIGRIPTRAETLAFLTARDPGKREALIDQLLDSEGYVSHHFNYWADILRVQTRLNGAGQSAPAGYSYTRWVKQALRDNMPYDEMVQSLVSAEGRSWENGAVGYYIRDYGMNLCNMAVTTQIFLGTSVQCAQCHNHPFDKWTQMDFYQAAAFQYNVLTTNNSENQSAAEALLSKDKKADSKYRRDVGRAFSEILKPLRFNNVVHRDRDLALPADYQYSDAKPKSKVEPEALFEVEHGLQMGKDDRPIEAFARWISSEQTPRFTKVIANRMWQKVMGIGLYEPVDEIVDDTEVSNPQLEAFLIETMEEFDFDLKRFMAMLYNTRTFQRTAHPADILPGEIYHYPGPVLKRMSAEQLWDSLVTLTVDEPDAPNPYAELAADKVITRTRWIGESVYDQSPQKFLAGAKRIADTQKELAREMQELGDASEKAREAGDLARAKKLASEGTRKASELVRVIESTVYQDGFDAKLELVSETASESDKSASREVAQDPFLSELASCIADDDIMKRAGGADSPMTEVVKAVLADRESDLKSRGEARQKREWQQWGIDSTEEKKAWSALDSARRSTLMRASDIDQPAPPGHFLREFGQSDRELIHNSSREASITQALSLLNNPRLFESVSNPYTVLRREVRAAGSPEEKLEAICLCLLNRHASADERELLLPIIRENPDRGPVDVAWTLLNTREFMFIQ